MWVAKELEEKEEVEEVEALSEEATRAAIEEQRSCLCLEVAAAATVGARVRTDDDTEDRGAVAERAESEDEARSIVVAGRREKKKRKRVNSSFFRKKFERSHHRLCIRFGSPALLPRPSPTFIQHQ